MHGTTPSAACGFIIPGKGMEVVNIGGGLHAPAADQAIRAGLSAHETFESILKRTTEYRGAGARPGEELFASAAAACSLLLCLNGWLPGRGRDFHSVLSTTIMGSTAPLIECGGCTGCCAELGIHRESVEPEELLHAMAANFEGYEACRTDAA